MHFSHRKNFILILLLIILNTVLRLQVVGREIGFDSFLMHIMINSLNEYGYAKWFLHPLSFAGLYPDSYASSVLFFLSGIQQITGLETDTVIFIYSIFQATLSIFVIYLMAGSFIDDDLFKHIVAFAFSTSPAIVTYTTYTIGTRPIVIILIPLLMYILVNRKLSYRKVILIFLLISFMFVTHHMFIFILPIIVIFAVLKLLSNTRINNNLLIRKIPSKYHILVPVLIPITLFLVSFSIPFIFKKFLEGGSRYDLPIVTFVRYLGPLMIYSIGGTFYLTLKQKKSFNEWVLLSSIISLMPFIYVGTYIKWLLPVFSAPFAGIGMLNVFNIRRESTSRFLIVILVIAIIFTSFYQFLGNQDDGYYERYIKESTFKTGQWIKVFSEGNSISNDRTVSFRLAAYSDTSHFLTPSSLVDAIYDFTDTNVSLFKRYPISSEDFWFSGYDGPDIGEDVWYRTHKLLISPKELKINYVVEDVKGNGNIIWNHGSVPSKILELSHSQNLIYDIGNIKIWQL